MPLMIWKPPAGGPHGVSIEVRVADEIYTLVDGEPRYIDPQKVAAVTTAAQAAVPSSTLTAASE